MYMQLPPVRWFITNEPGHVRTLSEINLYLMYLLMWASILIHLHADEVDDGVGRATGAEVQK